MEIKYYPAIFYRSGDGIGVVFPDLDGCVSYGENEQAAAIHADEALNAHLALMIQQNAEIPLPSQLHEVADDPDGEAVGRMLVRAEIPKRWIRINLSMAENLVSKIDLAAQSLGMSRSGYLAEAARRMLLQS